jgi:pimeloyl-ACP methyl ester carboxylesterase
LPFVNIGEIDLYYEVHGEGYPLLLITGLGGSTLAYEGQIAFFREHYKCIAFDNRGAGRSGRPAGIYTIEKMAEDALGLLDRLRVEKTFVFSISMGGMIALKLASMATMRLGAMLLGCTHAGGKSLIPPSPEVISLLADDTGGSREEIIRKQIPLFFSEKFQAENPLAIEEFISAQLLTPAQPRRAFFAQLHAITCYDSTVELAQVRNPALIVTGTEDVLIPPANSTYLAEHLPNAELISIPGAGHSLHFECRDFINRTAHAFYQKHLRD